MKKFHYLACFLIMLCSVVGVLSGCGGSINDLRVSLSGQGLVSKESNIYELTLQKVIDDTDESWSAAIDAEVLGLSGNMTHHIGWTFDSMYVEVTYNEDGTKAVIKGVNSTKIPTEVEAFSIENREVKAIIKVTNIITPKRIVGAKYGAGELGIPIGESMSLDPGELFVFDPVNATIPDYEFDLDGVIVDSTKPFILDSELDGYIAVTATPKNVEGYTETELANLSFTLDRVRVYTPLSQKNTILCLPDEEEDVTEVTLIKNTSDMNKAVLKVSAPSNFEYTLSSADNIIYDEITNKNGAVKVSFDSRVNEFILVGVGSLEEFASMSIHFTVAGVKNSLVLTKTFKVRVVDYPTAIRVNGVSGESDVELRVFDQYPSGERGTALRLNVAPESKIYRDISIVFDQSSTLNLELISKLEINGKPFTGEYTDIKSGDTLYLTNNQGYGRFTLLVYATNTMGTANEVVRKVIISLEQSVTNIAIDPVYLDQSTNNLILELDEYDSNVTTHYRDITVNIEPATASFDTVNVSSANTDIATVEIVDYLNCLVSIKAKSVGYTRIYFTAQSGVSYYIPVRVIVKLKQITVSLDPNISKIMVGKDLTTYKSVDIGAEGVTANTLDRAYIAKTGSGNGVYMVNTFYPESAVTANMISSIEFVSSNNTIATAINTNASIYRNVLTTERAGEVTFDMVIQYYVLEGNNLVLRTNTLNAYFTIQVFDQISSIETSDTNVELLAAISNISIGDDFFNPGGSSANNNTQSVYDLANNSKTLRVSVYPNTSTVLASSAKWRIEGNSSKMKLDRDTGSETTITALPLSGYDNRVSVTVVVSVTDLNGITFTKEIKVVSTKIQPITEVYIDNYANSLKNNSLYFELYKDDGFELEVTTAPASATNKKLEYIIFDAELLPRMQTGQDIIKVANSSGTNKYSYYRILPRDPNVDAIYNTQYECKTASLLLDADTGNYTIKPKKAGYAFVFIIPQDAAKVKIDTVTQLTDQMRNVTDKSTIKRIPVTVADGLSVPYQLYTADDVASIGKNVYGLDKHYYVMNTIDMSAYFNKNLAADPLWEWVPIGSVSEPFTGTLQSMVYNGESPTQSIVGWSLSRNLTTIDTNSTRDWRNFGIFGVVTGEIKNLNIYINTYTVNQSARQEVVSPVWNNYNYGLLVGKLTTREIVGEDETVVQKGAVSDVLVYCGKLNYTYTHKATDKINEVYANFGAIGYLDLDCTANNIDVTVDATIKSTDIIVNLGGVVGRNYGTINTPTTVSTDYASVVEINATADVVYDNAKNILSSIGGVVGQNYGSVYSVNVTGSIATTQKIVVSGGVVGLNYPYVFADSTTLTNEIINVLSSVKLSSTATDSVQGGIVGFAKSGTISYAFYDIYDTSRKGPAMNVVGSSGGIAGILQNATITRSIVQAYDITDTVYNVVSNGGTFGGLVGVALNSAISTSFVNMSIKANAGFVAGLVGEADSTTSIQNAYVRGIMNATTATAAAIIAVADNTVVNSVYADFVDDSLAACGGLVAGTNVWVIRDTASDEAAGIINRQDALSMDTTDWIFLGFDGAYWAIDSANSDPTNEGYAYLIDEQGNPFVRLIPKSITVNAKTFDNIVDDKINTILNVDSDTKKLVIAYQEGMVYDLSFLFSLVSEPVINPANISLNMMLTGSSVAQILSSASFATAKLKILGTGTAYIKIVSSQNSRAYDVVQICVINGFDTFDIVDEEQNSVFVAEDEDNYILKIKHNSSTQAFVSYYFGEDADGGKISVSSVDGGLKFVTGLYLDQSGDLATYYDDSEVITNYKISIHDWQKGDYNGLECLYHYVAHNDKIVLTAVGDDRDTQFITVVIPYINVQFYELDADKNMTSLNRYTLELGDYNSMSFDTKLYFGVEDIAMGVGDGTMVSAGDSLHSGVTIFNDAFTPDMTIDDLLWYQLYGVDEEGNTSLLGYFDPTLDTDKYLSSEDIFVTFEQMEYYASTNAVVLPYRVELSQSMRNSLTENSTYRIVIGAIDDNGQKLSDKVVSLQWTFIPQEVNHLKIEHFSDAINSGAKLKQAGDTPTNTIVAGEYGLLRITLSPSYANFESVEVTSSLVNGTPMMFDQRVLEQSVDASTNEVIYSYLTWQQGVGNITNGLSLSKASNINGDFDGVFYVRTICLGTLSTGTQFTITVTITQNGVRHTYSRDLTVYKTDVLSLSGEHYSQTLGTHIVAQGTGYTTSQTLVQNQNPLTVSIGPAYYDAELTVDDASRSKGARVVRENNKYYLYTGSVSVNNIITVTLTAKQDIGGFTYRATREITYEVVDFYISTLRDDIVTTNTKRFAFIDEKVYDLRLFEGITNENLNSVKSITFDTANIDTRNKVLNAINSINGIGESVYNGWMRRAVASDGTMSFVNMLPSTEWINGNYQFILSKFNGVNNGYSLVSSGISSGNVIRYELSFYYDAGEFRFTDASQPNALGLTTQNINVEFYQVTSQEHPQPIRTLNQFTSMQPDIDYILLNDLYITEDWSPINVAVKSFNGNGYKIHFKPTSISATEANYGLFGTIAKASVIKNVYIEIDREGLTPNSEEGALSSLNFGVLAGNNEGIVYNCQVSGLNNNMASTLLVSEPSSSEANFNIAGLVGVNAGNIINSRVMYTNIKAYGNVSGLTVSNSGTISGCYYTGGTITNLAQSSKYATAGLVINNEYGAKVLSSFAGGTYTVTTDNVTTLDTRVLDERDATIQSGVTAAGLVYANYGAISDCYTGVQIFSTRMSGFVFTNYASGKISRCYSTSDLSSTGSIIDSYPFIGVSGDNANQNNNYNKTDGIVNCYYYDSGFASTRLEEAKVLSAEDFCGTNGNTVFNEYIFSRTGEEGSEFSGVWTFVDQDNLYFTAERFASPLILNSGITDLYTNFGPKLVNASLIATPRMLLAKSEENSNGEIVHSYTYKYSSVFNAGHVYDSQDATDYDTDYTYDPVIVSNIEQFNAAFDSNNQTLLTRGEGNSKVILSDIRIVNNIAQSELSTGAVLNSPTARYAGILSGNGFTFSGVSLAVNDESTTRYGLLGTLCRVDKETTESIHHIGTIKNYNVTINNISCSTVDYVGGMVGVVDSANLYDVTVTGTTSRVVGNNVVGGIAGLVTGTSRVSTAYSNVGVTANYRANTEMLYNSDLIRAHGFDADSINDVSVLGYAGGLFGIVDLTQFDMQNPSSSDNNEARVYNIWNDAGNSVVGKVAGGLIGGVGVYSVIYNAEKIVQPGSLIKGYVFSGGVVGQNNGFLKYANLVYPVATQKAVDALNTGTTSEASITLFDAACAPLGVGGIAGINIGSQNIQWPGGTILLSSSKVAVRDITAQNVGGIAGVVYGGDIRACLATGPIMGSKTAYIGGAVGYLSDFSSDTAKLVNMDNPFGTNKVSAGTTLDYIVAQNNYMAGDYNYYYTLNKNATNGLEGAIGGVVGFVYDSALIYTTHTVATQSSDPYAYLTNPTNYFVSQITDRILSTTQIAPVTSGSYINLYEEDGSGKQIYNQAVGKYGNSNSINLATGLTRGYMLANYDEIFAGWDSYSLDNEGGSTSIVEQDLPNIIEVDSIEDLKIMYWHPEKTYVLIDDIDFVDTTQDPSLGKRIKTAFFAIGSESAPFTGKFYSRKKADGTTPMIKNVYIINAGGSSVGFFGALSDAVIKDIIIQDIHYTTALNQNASASVGALAGVVTNSTINNVSILNVDTANSGIYTNANVVGGMFGEIRGINSGKTVIQNCFVENNLVLTDNVYSTTTASGAIDTYYGGFAGIIEGDVSIESSISTGAMSVQYTDTTAVTTAQGERAREIAHNVGGFSGMIVGLDGIQNGAVSNTTITLDNVLSHTRAGGFVGVANETNLYKVDSHSDIIINFANISDQKNIYVGGLVGEFANSGGVRGFVSAGDIILNGDYGVDTINGGVAQNHYVAGIVGYISGINTACAGGYSVTSIKNNTILQNTFAGIGYSTSSNIERGSLLVDRYYSLAQNDTNNLFASSASVMSGGGLDSTGEIFTRQTNQYYRIKSTWANIYGEELYLGMYTGATGLYKTAPILVGSATAFSNIDNESLYYLQTRDITIQNKLYGVEQIAEFNGVYNGGGYAITLPAHFDINNSSKVSTQYAGLFGEIGAASMLTGVVLKDVLIYANLSEDVDAFGLLAGKTNAGSKLNNCFVSGEINLNVAGNTSIGGLVGINGAIITGCATDITANLYGDGAYLYGALYGSAFGQNSVYTLIDCYTAGRINNNGANATIAGMIADNSVSSLYAKNNYTMTEINTQNTANSAPVVARLNAGAVHNADGIWYDSGNLINKSNTIIYNTYEYSEASFARSFDDFGPNFIYREGKNNGMPIQKWLNALNDVTIVYNTGTGLESDPYIINTATQLAWALNNTTSQYYRLDSDIDYRLISGISGYAISDFMGHLDGNSHKIDNLSQKFINNISGSVNKLAFSNVATTGTIFAESITGSASEIYVDSATGRVTTLGNITNSISQGATFGTNATNCFTDTITAQQYASLDSNTWIYDGAKYTLKSFVPTFGASALPYGQFSISAVQNDGSQTITIASDTDFANAIYYATHFDGEYVFMLVSPYDTLNLNNAMLVIPNTVTQIIGLKEISNGYLTEQTVSYVDSDAIKISNAGIYYSAATPLFGANSSGYDSVSIENSVIVRQNSGALLFNTIDSNVSVSLNGVTVFAKSTGISLVATMATSTYSVNVADLNVVGNALSSVINSSSGAASIAMSNTNGQITSILPGNTGTAQISISGNSGQIGSVVTNNNGICQIDLATTAGHINTLVSNNAAAKTAIININSAFTDNNAMQHFVATNSGTVTINVNATTNLTNTTQFAFVGNSSGVINLNINAETTLNSQTVAGVVSTYSANNSNANIVVTLQANLVLNGTSAAAIATNSGSFDATVNLTYNKNSFDILVNSVAYDPNPVPTPEPEPDAGEGEGGQTGE